MKTVAESLNSQPCDPTHPRKRLSRRDGSSQARQVADRIGVSAETVLRWTRRGQLPAFRVPGGALRYRCSNGFRHATRAFGTVKLRELERMSGAIARDWQARLPERSRYGVVQALRQTLEAGVRSGYMKATRRS